MPKQKILNALSVISEAIDSEKSCDDKLLAIRLQSELIKCHLEQINCPNMFKRIFEVCRYPVLFGIILYYLHDLTSAYYKYKTGTLETEYNISQNENYKQRIDKLESMVKCLDMDKSGEPRVTVVQSCKPTPIKTKKPCNENNKK